MESNWKSVLYHYVQTRNRMEIEFTLEPIYPLLSDDQVASMQSIRLKRIRQSLMDRQAQPLKQETRMRLRHIAEHQNKVTVDLDLRKIVQYELKHIAHMEERMEYERVTLVNVRGRWKIAKIVPYIPERNRYFQHARHDEPLPPPVHAQLGSLPLPYFHRGVYTNLKREYRGRTYNRMKAVQYADQWWNRGNPHYIEFEVDCTNYVSQCLFAGEAPMDYTGKRESGWWYSGKHGGKEQWSFSWAVAQSLLNFLLANRSGLRAVEAGSAAELIPGDLIVYDWDGDGRFQHSAVVTSRDASGMPLVNAHTTNSKRRYWDYRDSYAWGEKTVYRFLHIADQF